MKINNNSIVQKQAVNDLIEQGMEDDIKDSYDPFMSLYASNESPNPYDKKIKNNIIHKNKNYNQRQDAFSNLATDNTKNIIRIHSSDKKTDNQVHKVIYVKGEYTTKQKSEKRISNNKHEIKNYVKMNKTNNYSRNKNFNANFSSQNSIDYDNSKNYYRYNSHRINNEEVENTNSKAQWSNKRRKLADNSHVLLESSLDNVAKKDIIFYGNDSDSEFEPKNKVNTIDLKKVINNYIHGKAGLDTSDFPVFNISYNKDTMPKAVDQSKKSLPIKKVCNSNIERPSTVKKQHKKIFESGSKQLMVIDKYMKKFQLKPKDTYSQETMSTSSIENFNSTKENIERATLSRIHSSTLNDSLMQCDIDIPTKQIQTSQNINIEEYNRPIGAQYLLSELKKFNSSKEIELKTTNPRKSNWTENKNHIRNNHVRPVNKCLLSKKNQASEQNDFNLLKNYKDLDIFNNNLDANKNQYPSCVSDVTHNSQLNELINKNNSKKKKNDQNTRAQIKSKRAIIASSNFHNKPQILTKPQVNNLNTNTGFLNMLANNTSDKNKDLTEIENNINFCNNSMQISKLQLCTTPNDKKSSYSVDKRLTESNTFSLRKNNSNKIKQLDRPKIRINNINSCANFKSDETNFVKKVIAPPGNLLFNVTSLTKNNQRPKSAANKIGTNNSLSKQQEHITINDNKLYFDDKHLQMLINKSNS